MKRYVVNTLATTALALLLLSVIALIFGGKLLFIRSVFQTFLANMIIHAGLLLMHKIEFKYIVLELLADISFIVVVLIACGAIFQWYSSTPIWTLVIMAVVIYLLSLFLNLVCIQQDAREINELIQKRDRKEMENAEK